MNSFELMLLNFCLIRFAYLRLNSLVRDLLRRELDVSRYWHPLILNLLKPSWKFRRSNGLLLVENSFFYLFETVGVVCMVYSVVIRWRIRWIRRRTAFIFLLDLLSHIVKDISATLRSVCINLVFILVLNIRVYCIQFTICSLGVARWLTPL